VELKGKNAVVVGRSNIVGMPAALMLMKKGRARCRLILYLRIMV